MIACLVGCAAIVRSGGTDCARDTDNPAVRTNETIAAAKTRTHGSDADRLHGFCLFTAGEQGYPSARRGSRDSGGNVQSWPIRMQPGRQSSQADNRSLGMGCGSTAR